MAITIQTERELRKYLFETFLKQQQEKGLLQEKISWPQGSETNPLLPPSRLGNWLNSEDSEAWKTTKAVGSALGHGIKNWLTPDASDPDSAWNYVTPDASMWKDTIYVDFPVSFSKENIAKLEKYNEELLSKNNNDLTQYIKPAGNKYNTNHYELVYVLIKSNLTHHSLFTVKKDDISDLEEAQIYEKIKNHNKLNVIKKLYLPDDGVYLCIPVYILKKFTNENLKGLSFFHSIESDDVSEACRAVNLNLANEKCVFAKTIANNKDKNWNYTSLYLAIQYFEKSPLWNNQHVKIPQWDEDASRKEYGNWVSPEDYKKSLEYQSKHARRKEFFEDIKDPRPPLTQMQKYEKEVNELMQNDMLKASMIMDRYNKESLLAFADELQIRYNQYAQSLQLDKWKEIRSSLMLAQNGNAAASLNQNNTTTSTTGITSNPNQAAKDTAVAYLKSVYDDSFQYQLIDQLMQNKRIDSKKYSASWVIKPSLQKTDKGKYDEIKQALVDAGNITAANDRVALSNSEYNKFIDLNPSYKEFFVSIQWNPGIDYGDDRESVAEYEGEIGNTDIMYTSDYILAWDSGKSSFNYFFRMFNDEDINRFKKNPILKDIPDVAENFAALGKDLGSASLHHPQVIIDDLNMASAFMTGAGPYGAGAGLTLGAATSLASSWNRWGYINSLEVKQEEIQRAIDVITSNPAPANAILTNFQFEGINLSDLLKVDNIDSMPPENKISILTDIKNYLSRAELFEQFFCTLDSIGWIPIVTTYTKAKLFKLFQSKMQYAKNPVIASTHVQLPTITWQKKVKAKDGTETTKTLDNASYNELNDQARKDWTPVYSGEMQEVHINPNAYQEISNFLPGSGYTQQLNAAVDDVIEKNYVDLFIPSREIFDPTKTKYKIDKDNVKNVTFKKGDEITEQQYEIITNANPELKHNFVKNTQKDPVTYTWDKGTVKPRIFKEGDKLSSEEIDILNQNLKFTLNKEKMVKDEITFDQLKDALVDYVGTVKNDNFNNFTHENIITLAHILNKKDISPSELKDLYQKFYNLSNNDIPDSKDLLHNLQAILNKTSNPEPEIKAQPASINPSESQSTSQKKMADTFAKMDFGTRGESMSSFGGNLYTFFENFMNIFNDFKDIHRGNMESYTNSDDVAKMINDIVSNPKSFDEKYELGIPNKLINSKGHLLGREIINYGMIEKIKLLNFFENITEEEFEVLIQKLIYHFDSINDSYFGLINSNGDILKLEEFKKLLKEDTTFYSQFKKFCQEGEKFKGSRNYETAAQSFKDDLVNASKELNQKRNPAAPTEINPAAPTEINPKPEIKQAAELTESEKSQIIDLLKINNEEFDLTRNFDELCLDPEFLKILQKYDTAEKIDMSYAVRFIKNNWELIDKPFPLSRDYASSWEIITDAYKNFDEIEYASGFKINSEQLDELAQVVFKENEDMMENFKYLKTPDTTINLDNNTYTFNIFCEDFLGVKFNPPKIEGGYEAFKKARMEWLNKFNKSRLNEWDYYSTELSNKSYGDSRIELVATTEFKESIRYIKGLNDFTQFADIRPTSNNLEVVFSSINDFLKDYEKFNNYLLFAKYNNNNFKNAELLDDLSKSGVVSFNVDSGQTVEQLHASFNDMQTRIKNDVKSIIKIESPDTIAGKSFNVDKNFFNLSKSKHFLGRFKRIFQKVELNFITALKKYREGLNDSIKALDEAIKQLTALKNASTDQVARETYQGMIDMCIKLRRKLELAMQSLNNTSLFSVAGFNIKNLDESEFITFAFNIHNYRNRVFTSLRHIVNEILNVFKDDASFIGMIRLAKNAGFSALTPIWEDITRLFNNVLQFNNKSWDDIIGEIKTQFKETGDYLAGIKKTLDAFSTKGIPLFKNNNNKSKIVTGVNLVMTVFINIPIQLFFFVASHPIFTMTSIKIYNQIDSIKELNSYNDVKVNFEWQKNVLMPILWSILARLTANAVLSGNAELKKQLVVFSNTKVQAHIVTYLKQLIFLKRRLILAHEARKDFLAKQKYDENIQTVLNPNNAKPLSLSDTNVDEMLENLKKQSLLLKNEGNNYQEFIDRWSNGNANQPQFLIQAQEKNSNNTTIQEKNNNIIKYGIIKTPLVDEEGDQIPNSFDEKYYIHAEGKAEKIFIHNYYDGKGQEVLNKLKQSFQDKGQTIFNNLFSIEDNGNLTLKESSPAAAIKSLLDIFKAQQSTVGKSYKWNNKINNGDPTVKKSIPVFKKQLKNLVEKNQKEYRNLSSNIFKNNVWQVTDDNQLVSEKMSLSSYYFTTSHDLYENFYSKSYQKKNALYLYWNTIKSNIEEKYLEVNNIDIDTFSGENGGKIFEKLSFLDFYRRMMSQEKFIKLNENKIYGIIGLFEDFLNDSNPDKNFGFLLGINTGADNKYFISDTATDNYNKLQTHIQTKEKLFQDNFFIDNAYAKKIQNVTESALGVDIISHLKDLVDLYNLFLLKIGLNQGDTNFKVYANLLKSTENADNKAKKVKLLSAEFRKFIVFLKAILLIKNCHRIQGILNMIKDVSNIKELSDNQKFVTNKDDQTEILDNRFDLKSILTNGLHEINYVSSQSDNKFEIKNSNVRINDIYFNNQTDTNYLDLIGGNSEDPLNSLFSNNLQSLTLDNDDLLLQFAKAIPTVDSMISDLLKLKDYFGNLINNSFNGEAFEDILKSQVENFTDMESQVNTLIQQGGGSNVSKNPVQQQLENRKYLNKNILLEDEKIVNFSVNNSNLIKNKKDQVIAKKNNNIITKKNNNVTSFTNKFIADQQSQMYKFNVINDVIRLVHSLKQCINYSLNEILINPEKVMKNLYSDVAITIDLINKNNDNFDQELQVINIFLNKIKEKRDKIDVFNEDFVSKIRNIKKEHPDLFADFNNAGIVQYVLKEKNRKKIRDNFNKRLLKIQKIDLNQIEKVTNENEKDSTSENTIALKFARMLYISTNFLIPMVKKINESTQQKQKIDLRGFLEKYFSSIENMYSNAIDAQKKEATEYLEFLRKNLEISLKDKKINDFSYIIGYDVKSKTTEITKLYLLSDLSNFKIKEDVSLINNFMLDIPYLYEIDVTEISEKNGFTITEQNLLQDKVVIKLSEEKEYLKVNKNNLEFDIYKFENNPKLLSQLKNAKLLLQNYKDSNTIFSNEKTSQEDTVVTEKTPTATSQNIKNKI